MPFNPKTATATEIAEFFGRVPSLRDALADALPKKAEPTPTTETYSDGSLTRRARDLSFPMDRFNDDQEFANASIKDGSYAAHLNALAEQEKEERAAVAEVERVRAREEMLEALDARDREREAAEEAQRLAREQEKIDMFRNSQGLSSLFKR